MNDVKSFYEECEEARHKIVFGLRLEKAINEKVKKVVDERLKEKLLSVKNEIRRYG